MPRDLQPATRPTMYFIGVTTARSSINAVFPLWARMLGLGNAELRGVDLPLQAEPARYREVVGFIRNDPLSLGALVTTHKIDVFAACADQFDELDPLTRSLREISSIFKREGRLHGRTVDPWTCGHALQSFLPAGHWSSEAEALVLGAGGAGTALAWQLSHAKPGATRPVRIHVADRLPERLSKLQQLHATWPDAPPLELHHAVSPEVVSVVLSGLPPRSLVVNATGAGKDTPGSPLSAQAVFPERALVWEFNYRGELLFLHQARAQQAARQLHLEDGWRYFLHGWTQVIADVFQREIPTAGPLFDELGQVAAAVR